MNFWPQGKNEYQQKEITLLEERIRAAEVCVTREEKIDIQR